MGTGGMEYRGYGIQGVWATWVMGHMGNGAHGVQGVWGTGGMEYRGYRPMGDWDFFAHSIINTGWILTKILLDIDINVFYLNTPRFFHDGLN